MWNEIFSTSQGVSWTALSEIAGAMAVCFGASLVFLRGRRGDIDASVNSRVKDLIEGQGGWADRLNQDNDKLAKTVEKVQNACDECIQREQVAIKRIELLEREVQVRDRRIEALEVQVAELKERL